MRSLTLGVLFVFVACQPADPVTSEAEQPPAQQASKSAAQTIPGLHEQVMAKPEVDANEMEVTHILVGVTGPRIQVQRTPEEAHALALDLWKELQAGADFEELRQKHTDDPGPPTYSMSTAIQFPANGVYPRSGMATAFGDVSYRLEIGEMGVTQYDPSMSPFGVHIIKRVR